MRLSLDNKLSGGLNAAGRQLRAFGGTVAASGAALTAAGGTIIAPLIKAAFDFSDAGDQIHKASIRTKASAEFLSQIGFAAEQSGGDLTTFIASLEKMNRRVANFANTGGGPAAKAMKDLGIAAKDLEGLNTEERFFAIVNALDEMPDRAFAAQKAFELGLNKNLLPLLEEGEGGIRKLMAQADQLGRTITQDDANKAANFGDAWNELKSTFKGVTQQVGASVAPMLSMLIRQVADLGKSVVAFIKENRGLIVTAFKVGAALFAAGTALTLVGGAIAAAGFALTGLATVFSTFLGLLAFVASPLGLLVAGLTGATAAFLKFTKTGQGIVGQLGKAFQFLGNVFGQVFGGIKDALSAGDLALAGRIAMTGLQVVLLKGVSALSNSVGGAFGDFIGKMGSDIISGDLGSAWETMVLGMAALWDKFVAGFLSVFEGAAKTVVNVWEGTVNKLTDFLLASSAEGGVTGAIASTLIGADVSEQQATAELQQIQARRNIARQLKSLRADREKAVAAGGVLKEDGQEFTVAQLDRAIASAQQALAKKGGIDVLADAQASARSITANTADSLREYLDAENAAERAAKSVDEFNKKIAGGADVSTEALDAAEKALADLRAEAAVKKKAALELDLGIDDPDDLDLGGLKGASTGVRSLTNVRAIQSLAGLKDRPIEKRMVDAMEKIERHTRPLEDVGELAIA